MVVAVVNVAEDHLEDMNAALAEAVAAATNAVVVVVAEAEIGARSRVPTRRTARQAFFMQCVPKQQKGCGTSQLFCFIAIA